MGIKIGALAKATDTKVQTIRYYEAIGLLPSPGRTAGNYRAYTLAHLSQLSFIRRARDLGFSLEQVRELLSLADHGDRPCAAVEEIARGHRAAVKRKVADLQVLGRELDNIIGQCGQGTVSGCGILEALAPVQARSMARADYRVGKTLDAE